MYKAASKNQLAKKPSNPSLLTEEGDTDSEDEISANRNWGLTASLRHPENGMQGCDMQAVLAVADTLDEVIMFRSTGPWSLRWIEKGFRTKNFHVKGKSSDWGPQAGLVPYDGIYSKVGHNPQQAANGTKANQDGINDNYASTTQLTLSYEDLQRQLNDRAGQPARQAIHKMKAIPGSPDYFLFARRSGDGKELCFRAVQKGVAYQIWVYPEELGTDTKMLMQAHDKAIPLKVMTSSEVGANNQPMTGDYDLMSICPKWGNYGSQSTQEISKQGLVFSGTRGAQPGQVFEAGVGLDKVLDMRTNTGARPGGGVTDATYQGLTKKDAGKLQEHNDMGNITPRILRCINELNRAMGAVDENAPFRRVHHNAESHRNHIFGALTKMELEKGEGLPITVFQPSSLQIAGSPTQKYLDVSTFETFSEFEAYVSLLHEAGYYVPKNWTWGMSIRDKYKL
ncbi:anthrax toxin-like adenylyl cyclase domain-containing protein [Collimonas humicola]|uniref:anthrax toxin-like adenylyl cyclase domain-containing protein n=1 Tax=Collimonas humicola TaxID=2825886 RepID=UPI001B8CAD31|nr:anthrax toxin-like adenylyl cyclase domain-containing protein [Collimonas humicola]